MEQVGAEQQNTEAEEPYTPGDVAADFVQDVLDAIPLDAEVELEQTADGAWLIDVVGPEAGEIIGRYGNTLNSLQYLTSLVTNRRSGEHTRLVLDANGYRERRRNALVDQALTLAGEVIRTGQEAELDPLGAFERRIIHNALANHPQVTTYSEGEDPDRRVIIAPRPPA